MDLFVCYLKLRSNHLLAWSLFHLVFHHSTKVFEICPSSIHFQVHFTVSSSAIAGRLTTHDGCLIDVGLVGNCHYHYILDPCYVAVTTMNLINHAKNYSGTAAHHPYFHLHPSYYCYSFIVACWHSYRLLASFLIYG